MIQSEVELKEIETFKSNKPTWKVDSMISISWTAQFSCSAARSSPFVLFPVCLLSLYLFSQFYSFFQDQVKKKVDISLIQPDFYVSERPYTYLENSQTHQCLMTMQQKIIEISPAISFIKSCTSNICLGVITFSNKAAHCTTDLFIKTKCCMFVYSNAYCIVRFYGMAVIQRVICKISFNTLAGTLYKKACFIFIKKVVMNLIFFILNI